MHLIVLKSLIREIAKVKNRGKKLNKQWSKEERKATREKGNKLKIFWRSKLFDTLSDVSSKWGGVGEGRARPRQ